MMLYTQNAQTKLQPMNHARVHQHIIIHAKRKN